jgi:hypothetical protein
VDQLGDEDDDRRDGGCARHPRLHRAGPPEAVGEEEHAEEKRNGAEQAHDAKAG